MKSARGWPRSDIRPPGVNFAKTKGRREAGLKQREEKLWPGPSAPRGAGGLRNPEHDPNRALRQRWRISQRSLARAWPKWGCIMIRINERVMLAVQIAARVLAAANLETKQPVDRPMHMRRLQVVAQGGLATATFQRDHYVQ